jgi:mannose-1-phosphate guanylyltransferase
MPKSEERNVIASGKAMMYDCKDCLVKLPGDRVVVVQGLEDYVIAEEDNVLVICKKDDQGAIRKFVNDVQINIGDDYV